MNLVLAPVPPRSTGIPRVSGGEPEKKELDQRILAYSPRERG